MKLLLTGFEPFLGESINPSAELLDFFQNEVLIETLLLPVSYQRAFHELEKKLKAGAYTDVLMLGQAGGRSRVCFERVALNWRDAETPDEDGVVIKESTIDPKGAPAYFTSYPLRAWYEEALALNLPVEISNSAGAYVCNSLSYQVAHWLAQSQQKHMRWLFVHVPYLPEQVKKDSSAPTMELEDMRRVVQWLVGKIIV